MSENKKFCRFCGSDKLKRICDPITKKCKTICTKCMKEQ